MNLAELPTQSQALKLNTRRQDYIDANIMQMLTQSQFPVGSALWHVHHISYGNTPAENQAVIRDVLGWREGRAT